MLPEVRSNKIKKLLLEKKSVMVSELAELFQVSEETARRDLRELEAEGFLRRTHGGGILQERVSRNIDTKDLQDIFVESKKIIAERVRKKIHNGDSIFIDSSTTSAFICEEIKTMKLTIISNSIDNLKLLSKYPNISLIGLGGNLSQNGKCFVGRTAIRQLEDYYFDLSIFSCKTLSMSEGVTDSRDDEAEIKRKVAERCNEAMLVADYSKFNKVSFVKISNYTSIDTLVTDRLVTDEWRDFLEMNGVKVIDE